MERLKEVIRVLLKQIREEQRLRDDCLTGKVSHEPIPEVTDEDVERRIKEILE